MKKFLQRLEKNEKGFTLIELIIVIAIIAVISAIAVPNILSAVDNAKKTTDVANAKTIANAAAIIKAKTDNTGTIAGYYTTSKDGITGKLSPTDTTPAAEGTAIGDFAEALNNELNGGKILPKYTGSSFVMHINTDGTIRVTIDTHDGVEVYPTPADAYTNN